MPIIAKPRRFDSMKTLRAGHPERVPAPQINVMHGPTYKQAFAAPVRPGALDFKQIGSKSFSSQGDNRG